MSVRLRYHQKGTSVPFIRNITGPGEQCVQNQRNGIGCKLVIKAGVYQSDGSRHDIGNNDQGYGG